MMAHIMILVAINNVYLFLKFCSCFQHENSAICILLTFVGYIFTGKLLDSLTICLFFAHLCLNDVTIYHSQIDYRSVCNSWPSCNDRSIIIHTFYRLQSYHNNICVNLADVQINVNTTKRLYS